MQRKMQSAASSRRPYCVKSRQTLIESLEPRQLLSTIVVNSPSGATSPPNGLISLRGAINTANASTTPTTITFSSSVFATRQTIGVVGANGLVLTNTSASTTIIGPAAGVLLDGGGANAVLTVDADVTVSISNATIQDAGYADNDDSGGGINNGGHLTLRNDAFFGNNAQSVYLAGALINYGTADVANVTFSGNGVDGEQGAILNSGQMQLVNITAIDNGIVAIGGSLGIGNSIVYGANDADFFASDPSVASSYGHNIIGTINENSSTSPFDATDHVGVDPKLGSLGGQRRPDADFRP